MTGQLHVARGRFRKLRTALLIGLGVIVLGAGVLWGQTQSAMAPLAVALGSLPRSAERLQVLDRSGNALNSTYANRWNVFEQVPLHAVPATLIDALILAEDQRFFAHHGQDWRARGRALVQNLVAGRVVRGASTITEQVVRMVNPRPRTFWSRWLEGWEARLLEQARSKQEILEFYLNQVPYAARRRGVVQAARYYFDRDLATLSVREILALAVLVRAPSRLDLRRGQHSALRAASDRLARRMMAAGALAPSALPAQGAAAFDLREPTLPVIAGHFLSHVLAASATSDNTLRTTLDGSLQRQLQGLLDQRLRQLSHLRLRNGALLVADHQRGEILAWVVGGEGDDAVPDHAINAVLARRQPGSALKPFLYALALEQGWTAATVIDDRPYAVALNGGLHDYHNYSRRFHGPVTLRMALANSLNIPALKALQFTGVSAYHARLRRLGFASLAHEPDYYGEGLALGNGEVSLLELVQAYSALANRGRVRQLAVVGNQAAAMPAYPVYSPEVASLIGHILSDPDARSLEFGASSLLNFPVQTAVKTGTSSDYRDSWAVGYDSRFVVGVWMGNLDQRPTYGVTGATGPALLLRATFDRLRRSNLTRSPTQPLWLSPRLRRYPVCAADGDDVQPAPNCRRRIEYFLPGAVPQQVADLAQQSVMPQQLQRRNGTMPHWTAGASGVAAGDVIRLVRPSHGLRLALDPRLDAADQAFEFFVEGVRSDDVVQWQVDTVDIVRLRGGRYLWNLVPGAHTVSATIWRYGSLLASIGERQFVVN